MTVEEFTHFQEERVTLSPPPKCVKPQYTRDTCYPQIAEEDCHKCGIKRRENQDK
jgi:hypothetical protein